MTVSASNLLGVIVLLPLLGAVVNGILGPKLPRRWVHAIGVGSVAVAFVLALRCFYVLMQVADNSALDPHLSSTLYTWAASGIFHFDVAFYLDPLSAVLLLVVTGVGMLIHIYSIGYMSHDPSVARYFAYLNLFMFSMLVLILGKNLLMLFVGWEGVGLCSYLLIGFWFTDDAKAQAGQKAFVVNRIGDFGFIMGLIILMYYANGTTDYDVLKWYFEKGELGPFHDSMTLAVCCLLMLVGATGKSAQIPLYVWLPDAMAGPTPVSALIHAATMVTAGVYMIARLSFMFTLSGGVMLVIAVIGALTALFAALMALTQRDIKKVLAYSTVSQLGYMVLAVGVGAFVAGVFHLMTHAFFKALLFLAAGSVIHGMSGEQDIFKMGGLKRKLPTTRATFLIATLAIAGVPFLSGFYSKDMILWEAYSRKQLLPIPANASAGWGDGDHAVLGGQQGLVLIGEEGSWSRVQVPRTVAGTVVTRPKFPAVLAATRGDDGSVWLATKHATIYRYARFNRTVERYLGFKAGLWRSWDRFQLPAKYRKHGLNAIVATDEDEVWAVGDGGLIVHLEDGELDVTQWDKGVSLRALVEHDGTLYAAGDKGTVLRLEGGGKWVKMTSTGSSVITALTVGDDTVYGTTGGAAPGVIAFKNGQWVKEPPGVIAFKNGQWVKEPVNVGWVGPDAVQTVPIALEELTAIVADGSDLVVAGTGTLGQRGPKAKRLPVILTRTDGAWSAAVGEKQGKLRALLSFDGSVVAAGTGRALLSPDGSGLKATSQVPYKPAAHFWLYLMAVIAAILTAFYMFRLYLLTFEGETRATPEAWKKAHESPLSMTGPLLVLAFFSIVSGYFGPALGEWLQPVFRVAETRLQGDHSHPTWFLIVAVGAAAFGLFVAWMLYGSPSDVPKSMARRYPRTYQLLFNKFYIDELYHKLIIVPFRFWANVLHKIVDVLLIDRVLVLGWGWLAKALGALLRPLQTGNVQQYAVWIAVGLAFVIWVMGT